MRTRSIRICATIAILASPALAQRTLVVDWRGGQGVYPDLPDAFAVAKHRDTILVRSGTYEFVRTGLGVRLLADGEVLLKTRQPSKPSFEIVDLPHGEAFVMKGFTIDPPDQPVRAVLMLSRNLGAVVLEDVHVATNPLSLSAPSIEASFSRQVSLNRVEAGELRIGWSTVTASDCRIYGPKTEIYRFGATATVVPARPGIEVNGSTLILGQCVVTGGDGDSYAQQVGPPKPAIVSGASDLVLAGDRTSRCTAGAFTGYDVDALSAAGGNLVHDPSVALEPSGNGKPHTGFAKTHARRLPSLTASGSAPGGKLHAEVYSPHGHAVVLLASAIGTPILIPALGQLWLDPASLLLLDIGIQDVTEHRRVRIPIPNATSLRGLVLTVQAASGVSLATLKLSVATHVVLH